MNEWRARAPVRFCDLGGWTDTRIVPRGAVLNFAARMYTYATLRVQEGAGGFTLESLDTDERYSFSDVRRVEYNGVLDLLKAAVARSGIEAHAAGSIRFGARLRFRCARTPRRPAGLVRPRLWASRPWARSPPTKIDICCRMNWPVNRNCWKWKI